MKPTSKQPSSPDRAAEHWHGIRERLTFSHGLGAVPGRAYVDATTAAAARPTFAAATYIEPRDWGYLGLFAFTAVLLLRPQEQVSGLTSFHVAEICALIGIAPMLLHRFANRLPVFRITGETLGLAAFGAILIGTAAFSIWPGGALQEVTDSYLKILIVFVLMMNTLTTPKRLERLTWLILLCVGYMAARGVFDYARGVNLVEGGRLAGSVGGIFGNSNDLAMNMVTFMPLAAVIALSRRQRPWRRLAAGLIVGLMMATIVFTESRSGMLGLVVMLAALVLLGWNLRPGFGPIVITLTLLSVPLMPAAFWTRMATIVDQEQDKQYFTGSSQARQTLLQEGISAFFDHPFTGVGAGQFKNYNPPERKEPWRETHNVLIQVASETGIAGLVAFTFLIFCAIRAAWAARRLLAQARGRRASDTVRAAFSDDEWQTLHDHAVALTAGFLGWLMCAMFASVAYGWTFYYVLALLVATREITRERLEFAETVEADRDVQVRSLSSDPSPSSGRRSRMNGQWARHRGWSNVSP